MVLEQVFMIGSCGRRMIPKKHRSTSLSFPSFFVLASSCCLLVAELARGAWTGTPLGCVKSTSAYTIDLTKAYTLSRWDETKKWKYSICCWFADIEMYRCWHGLRSQFPATRMCMRRDRGGILGEFPFFTYGFLLSVFHARPHLVG